MPGPEDFRQAGGLCGGTRCAFLLACWALSFEDCRGPWGRMFRGGRASGRWEPQLCGPLCGVRKGLGTLGSVLAVAACRLQDFSPVPSSL